VVGYAVIYLPFTDPLGVSNNPFAAAGYAVLIASAVMVIVTLLAKPMPDEFLNSIFGEKRGPGRAPSPEANRGTPS
jgi:hypothetical protein